MADHQNHNRHHLIVLGGRLATDPVGVAARCAPVRPQKRTLRIFYRDDYDCDWDYDYDCDYDYYYLFVTGPKAENAAIIQELLLIKKMQFFSQKSFNHKKMLIE